MMVLVTENQLDNWVRGNARDAQELIVELVWRLVAASCPNPQDRRFPLGDSIGQHGPDGILHVDLGFNPFVPEGLSYWEIGTGLKSSDKATSDYKNLTNQIPKNVRSESTFVFVTPLSGGRGWEYTWKESSQAKWLKERRNRNEWKDVQIIDGTKLVGWVHQFLAVEIWLAGKIHGSYMQHIEIPEHRWDVLRTIGAPPLIPDVFLAGRDEACAKLKDVFDSKATQLTLTTRFPDQAIDFVCAYLASLDEESHIDAAGRCLIVSHIDTWNRICDQGQNLILVADTALDLSDNVQAIQKAHNFEHAVIMCGPHGGPPDSTRVPLPLPRSSQLQKALQDAGYETHRVHTLIDRCNGDLGSLLRLLQNRPGLPKWEEHANASALATAVLLGSWVDESEADRTIVQKLAGEEYDEWINKIREVAFAQDTPIFYSTGNWKFSLRYEGWYALGQRFFSEHLDTFRKVAVLVLREKHPQFELPTHERMFANIQGKVPAYSPLLRKGLAESLALLGSHPDALSSCTSRQVEDTAILAVREILSDADWVLWASLNDVLPLLAEAAPGEFLDAIEKALSSDPCPFDELFAQESTGSNYLTGLLWALEGIAWDEQFLVRACVALGELASRDPGGKWGNRPAHSLRTILLPWLPQTTASVQKRQVALLTLQREVPPVAWQLLLGLLPQYSGGISLPTHKLTWRDTIPDDWKIGVSHKEYWEQIDFYADLTVDMAHNDIEKMEELIDQLDNLPQPALDRVLEHLSSADVSSKPEDQRLGLWTKLTIFAQEHRQFSDAKWALDSDSISKIEGIAARLAPKNPLNLHRMLFKRHVKKLEQNRQQAIKDILDYGGMDAVMQFVEDVEAPFSVGCSLGAVADTKIDERLLPELLETDNEKLVEFINGYIKSRRHHNGRDWVDELDRSGWSASLVGKFLSYLPFTEEAWRRAEDWLGQDEGEYWSIARFTPPLDCPDLGPVIDKLIENKNLIAAIYCLSQMLHDQKPLDKTQALNALRDVVSSTELVEAHDIIEIIKALQDDPETNPEDLFRIEWAYLPLLGRYQGTKTLENRLASDPAFFCEVIGCMYGGQDSSIAANVWRLLQEWRTPPGMQPDGEFIPDQFKLWLKQVKEICAETGHLEVALINIGKVLIHCLPDPDGQLWIHRAVAEELNDKSAEKIRKGYSIGTFNSRDVYEIDPTGKSERELAEQYRKKAEDIENEGYQRLAATLRMLAEDYEHQAKGRARYTG